MNLSVIYIVGVGRSGTSLVQSMFAANPAIAYLPETAFLRRYVSKGKLQSIYEKHGEESVVKLLKADERFKRTKVDAKKIISRALMNGGQLDAAVYLELLASFKSKNKKWIGDKDPRVIEYLPLLKTLVPNAHVINVFRDPRDVLVSKKKANWSNSRHVWKHIFANRVQIKMGNKFGYKLFGKDYHEIFYEELISTPKKILAELCKNLRVDYDESMLLFRHAAKKLVSEEEMSWKKETLGPLLTNNSNKWKNELSYREVKLTEICCNEAMYHGRYIARKQIKDLRLWDKIWIHIGRFLIVIVTWPYILLRIYIVRRACKKLK